MRESRAVGRGGGGEREGGGRERERERGREGGREGGRERGREGERPRSEQYTASDVLAEQDLTW
jgi:hypothetical protein